MKRNLLVFALVAIIALSVTSCGKKNEKTNTDKLCTEKGWVLKSATVTPAITVSDDPSVKKTTNDFYADWLLDSERDDIMVFAKSGAETIKPGAKKPADDEEGYVEDKASTWKFNDDESVLTCQLPFWYDATGRTFDAPFENCTISKLTETEMVLIYKGVINFNKTEYTFTLTYNAK